MIHRDYRRLGTVHLQLHDFPPRGASRGHISIINPGGFVQGIRLDNLLTVNPRPRNPRLADCFKRIGLVERIGRGVNIIYEGQLKNGHLPPIYDLNDEVSVQIKLYSGPTDLEFVRLLVNFQRERQQSFNVRELLLLNHIHRQREIDIPTLANLTQQSATETLAMLEGLIKSGILEQKSSGAYQFSAKNLSKPKASQADALPYDLEPELPPLSRVESRIEAKPRTSFQKLFDRISKWIR